MKRLAPLFFYDFRSILNVQNPPFKIVGGMLGYIDTWIGVYPIYLFLDIVYRQNTTISSFSINALLFLSVSSLQCPHRKLSLPTLIFSLPLKVYIGNINIVI